MTENQKADSAPSFCEIAGCSGPAVSEVWSIDEDRHLQVCWKHADEQHPEKNGS